MKKSSFAVRSVFATVALAFTLASTQVRADQGLRISGGAIELVGTVSTMSYQNDKTLYTMGWVLIVLGMLVNAGDISYSQTRRSTTTRRTPR